MADQVIFTSAVRGIKPGASGYCIVLRSPGIRTALEQALEKISVFEHSKCNSGRITYSYRQIEVRDTTYCVLSRIGDADKDYTGRTNFLAHHLVFQKEELPDLSPADILLNWSGWCQQWIGEPREESVNLLSLQELPKIYPPAKTWKDQAIGVDGAIELASDMQNSFALRSKDCTDSSLLLLIAEALAVRAKFKKSYQYTWTTTFSVGLASTISANAFKWLMIRASDDYDLPNVITAIDLDATLLSDHNAGEEIAAIAHEGQYSPQRKPIPLNSEKSYTTKPISGSGQTLPPQGGWGRPTGNYKSHPIKTGPRNLGRHGNSGATSGNTKRRNYVLLVSAISLLILAGGIWSYSKQPKPSKNYENRYNTLIGLHDKLNDSPNDTAYRDQVKSAFRAMYVAYNPENVSKPHEIEQDIDLVLDQMREIDWKKISTEKEQSVKDDHDKKFGDLRKFLLVDSLNLESPKDSDLDEGRASGAGLGNKSEGSAVESAVETPEPDSETIEEVHASEAKGSEASNTDTVKPEAINLSPLNLNNYRSVVVLQMGIHPTNKIVWNDYRNDGVSFSVTNGLKRLEALNEDAFTVKYKAHPTRPYALIIPESASDTNIVIQEIDSPVAMKIIYEGKEYEQKPELWAFIDKGSDKTLKLGVFDFKDKKSVSAEGAFGILNDIFDSHIVDLWIVAEDGYATKLISRSTSSHQTGLDKSFRSIIEKLSGDTEVSSETINKFNELASGEMVLRLENKLNGIKKDFSDSNLLPKRKAAERSALLSAYNEIIGATKKGKTIRDYYDSYRKAKDRLEREMNNEKDKDREGGIGIAYSKLKNYFADIFESEKEDGIGFKCSWNEEAEDLKFTFFNSPYNTFYEFSEEELEVELKRIVQENEGNKIGQTKEDPYGVPRVWKRIEFRHPEGVGTVASIDIKYSI